MQINMSLRKKINFTIVLLVFLGYSSFVYSQQEIKLYVSPAGNDKNNGTLKSPFSTIAYALQKVAALPPAKPVIIYLREGYYPLSQSIIIDSATAAGHNLLISAYKDEKVLVGGGVKLNTTEFHPVKDPSVLQRLPDAARKKVYETDMNAQGVTDYGNRVPHGFARETTAPLELFFNNEPLVLARWPNNSSIPINRVSDHGSMPRSGEKENRGAVFNYDFDRPSSWKNKNDIWLYGVFAHSYADDNVEVDNIDDNSKTIKLKQASYYGVYGNDEKKEGNGRAVRQYYFYNILEELDTAGEWYLDKETAKLYLWPTSPIQTSSVFVSVLETPLIMLYHVRNVSIEGIQFGFGRGLGIYAAGTDNVTIRNCTFMNFGTKAISTSDPISAFTVNYKNKQVNPDRSPNSHFSVDSCTIFNTGTGGITVNGGDRKNLIAAGNSVTNCNIYNYSRINRASPPAIILGGVGNIVSHCYIHDGSSAAIGYNGNNHEISYSHISRVATEFSDIGAVYTGRDPSSTGNKIIYNFFDSIQSYRDYAVAAVYIDDGSGGMIVSGNIFFKCGNTTAYGAVHINGGADNKFINNYFIECPKAFSNTVWDDKKWKANMYNADMIKRITKEADIRSEKYIAQYPYLKTFFDSTGEIRPRVNVISNSFIYKVGLFTTGKTSFEINNSFTSQDGSEFINESKKNFGLKIAPPQLRGAAEWSPSPFDKIGPRN